MPALPQATLQVVETSNIPRIAAYLSAQMGQDAESWISNMRHWWDDNPAFETEMVRGWTLEAAGEIVGFLGNIPSQCQINGKMVTAYNPSTWYVSPDYRKTPLSRQLFHEFGKEADNAISFITTPAPHVVQFYREELQYQDFPQKPSRYYYYVYDYAQHLQLATSRKQKLLHGAFLPFYRWQQSKRVQPVRTHYRVEPVSHIDSSFDDLWEKARWHHVSTHFRDSKTLQWLLSGNRSEDKFLYGCYENNELVGFGLFMQKHDQGRATLECLDLFSASDNAEIFTAIVENVITHPPRDSFVFLKVPSFHQIIDAACTNLNLAEQSLSNYYMVRYGNEQSRLLEYGKSYLTGVHGDYALF